MGGLVENHPQLRLSDLRSAAGHPLSNFNGVAAGALSGGRGQHMSWLLSQREIRLYDQRHRNIGSAHLVFEANGGFGGMRPWLCCPECSARRGVLFVVDEGVGCRRCFGLTYRSTRVTAYLRRVQSRRKKIAALEARLGPDQSRPKGMHQRTYESLLRSLSDEETALVADLWLFIGTSPVMRSVAPDTWELARRHSCL